MKHPALSRRLPAFLLSLVLSLSCLLVFPIGVTAEETPGEYELIADSEAYGFIVDGLLALKSEINIEKFNLTPTDLQTLVSSIYYSEAELFFFGGQYRYSQAAGSETVKTLQPTYLGDTTLVPDQLSEFRLLTKAILDGAPKSGSDFEKILYVHDYVAGHFDYDHSLRIYDAYQFLKGGIGVCQAYSLLTRYLLDKLGVSCICVSCEELTHEWNSVLLDGKWYNMDVTWDDRDDKGFYGQVAHDNFLCSDASFMAGEHHSSSGWVAEYPATSTDYDGFFAEVTTPLWRLGDVYYCIKDGWLSTYSEETGLFTDLYELNLVWHTYHSASQIWNGTYAGLFLLDGKLYWNGEDAVYSYTPATGTVATVVGFDDLGGTAFGMRMSGEDGAFAFVFSTMTDPNVGSATEVKRSVGGYTITWVFGENNVKALAVKGEVPVCPDLPTLPANVFDYEFLAWDTEPIAAVSDATYTATFRMVRNAVDPSAETVKEARRLLRAAEYRLPTVGDGYPGATEALASLSEMTEAFNAHVTEVNATITSVFFGG